jgi:hypothetical protein
VVSRAVEVTRRFKSWSRRLLSRIRSGAGAILELAGTGLERLELAWSKEAASGTYPRAKIADCREVLDGKIARTTVGSG